MAKVSFTKLGLKKNEEVKIVNFNGIDIEVKQYLSINDKLGIIGNTIGMAWDDNNFANPIKLDVIGHLEIVYAYTNINFTDKQKEDAAKLYDLLDSSGLLNIIVSVIPSTEYNTIIQGIEDFAYSVYTYRNSVLGILEQVNQDYQNTEFDANAIQEKIENPENLGLLKDIMTKLG